MDDGIFIMKDFPDFRERGFNMDSYNERFKKNNVIIHAISSDVSYPEHWGCLSIKCAFGGNEYYETNGRFYAVNDNNYLVLNEGEIYSSYIYSKKPVESFTINFSSFFQETVATSIFASAAGMLDDHQHLSSKKIEFTEKLYTPNDAVSPVLVELYRLSLTAKPDDNRITEIYFILLEKMIAVQVGVDREIAKIEAVKPSTKAEIYKRLHYAKDFIDSCYMNNITLEQLAAVACLNSAYLLRQFKKYFSVTPYQYIIQKRLGAAKLMLESTSQTITDTCYAVGYEDATSFTKLFKQYFGLTPEKYRMAYQKKSVFTC